MIVRTSSVINSDTNLSFKKGALLSSPSNIVEYSVASIGEFI